VTVADRGCVRQGARAHQRSAVRGRTRGTLSRVQGGEDAAL